MLTELAKPHTEWDIRKISALVNAGADPEAKNDWGRTPLMLAAMAARKDILCALIAVGADTEAKDNNGVTALAFALREDHKSIISILNATIDRNLSLATGDGLKIGDKGADGWIYAGVSEDTGLPMFVAPENAGKMKWRAAQKKAGALNIRLPSQSELKHLFNNHAKIGGFKEPSTIPGIGDLYWSSSENIATVANGRSSLHCKFQGSSFARFVRNGLTVGDKIPDGSVYAGVSPDTNKMMYVQNSDYPGKLYFNKAANYAKVKKHHGHRDRRLPSVNELDIIFQNKETGALKGTFINNRIDNYYGSSMAGTQWHCMDFNSGRQVALENTAFVALPIRYVRS